MALPNVAQFIKAASLNAVCMQKLVSQSVALISSI